MKHTAAEEHLFALAANVTSNPTSCSFDATLLTTKQNKIKKKKKDHRLVPNFFCFYLVTSNKDAYGKCIGVTVSIFGEHVVK